MENKLKISDLEKVASLIPAPVSWVDANGIALGANDLLLRAVGASKAVLGKSLYDFYPQDVADFTIKIIRQVIKEKRLIEVEEKVADVETGKARWFLASRTPLFDDTGENIIGIVCISTDITDRKENERLRIAEKIAEKANEHLRIEKKLAEKLVQNTKNAAIEMARGIQEPLLAIKANIDNALTEIENLPVTPSGESQKNQLVSLLKKTVHDITHVSSNLIKAKLYDWNAL